MDDFQYANLGSELNAISSFNQPAILGNKHSDEDDFVDVCDDELPSASANLSVSHEDLNLDL